jgi:predicted PurR-regulated permease PerM
MKRKGLKNISFFIFIIFLVFVFILSKSIIKPIFFSFLFAYILKPVVNYLTVKKLNKRVSAFLALLMIMGLIFIIIFYIIPGITKDVLGILSNIDYYNLKLQEIIKGTGYDKLPDYLKNVISQSTVKIQLVITDYLKRLFNQIIDFSMELPTYILMPVFIYYFLVDSNYFLDILKSIIPNNIRGKAVELGREIDKVTGQFIRSQIILSLIISGLTLVALIALRIRYPVIIAFINGLTNIIPYFGPLIGLLPALASAASESVNKAIITAVVFFIIQEFESSLVAPKLMGESIGLHPVFIMVILLLGGKFFGGWGLVLAIPAAGIIKVSYGYIMKNLY